MIRKLLDGTHNLESYVDNILGHTKDWKEHMKILRDFFERVRKANYYLIWVNVKSDIEALIFWATLYMEIVGPQTESVGHILQTERPKTKKK